MNDTWSFIDGRINFYWRLPGMCEDEDGNPHDAYCVTSAGMKDGKTPDPAKIEGFRELLRPSLGLLGAEPIPCTRAEYEANTEVA